MTPPKFVLFHLHLTSAAKLFTLIGLCHQAVPAKGQWRSVSVTKKWYNMIYDMICYDTGPWYHIWYHIIWFNVCPETDSSQRNLMHVIKMKRWIIKTENGWTEKNPKKTVVGEIRPVAEKCSCSTGSVYSGVTSDVNKTTKLKTKTKTKEGKTKTKTRNSKTGHHWASPAQWQSS